MIYLKPIDADTAQTSHKPFDGAVKYVPVGEGAVERVSADIWQSIKRAMLKDAEPELGEIAIKYCIAPHIAALAALDTQP